VPIRDPARPCAATGRGRRSRKPRTATERRARKPICASFRAALPESRPTSKAWTRGGKWHWSARRTN